MAADQSVFNVLLAVFQRLTFPGELVFFFYEQSDWSYPSKSSVSGKQYVLPVSIGGYFAQAPFGIRNKSST